MNVSVIGLGKLGLCTAACIASKGHCVAGVDKDESVIETLKDRRCLVRENALPELLNESFERISFSSSVEEAIFSTDVTLIIVPTPSDRDGVFSNEAVVSVLREAGSVLKRKKDFHVVDVVSTVMPGSSEKEFIPLLENMTGKKCGIDFGFAYNPEFIALGSVIHDFLNPDLVLIGSSDDRTGECLRNLYESFVDSSPKFAVMSLINAEITKLALNCYVTMKITYANELARLCGAIDGANVDVVSEALGADTRIGGRCLKGGLGFAGPCFPRDNIAFQKLSSAVGAELFLPSQVVKSNDFIVDYLFDIVDERIENGAALALLGFSYKAGTHICECSQSLKLMNRFLEAGYLVLAHDPMAKIDVPLRYKGSVTVCDDPLDAVISAKGVLLLTPWTIYASMDLKILERKLAHPIHFFDCWRALEDIASIDTVKYWALGVRSGRKE
ncbi:MAG: nucleotide sugar dehydrogenase [Synergistaceae bacterium]|jgi:UDPglucose 6-dehydrogenase|nr:nucleotide sugar dehydrogenase [Synergistaceae bacterium]